MSHSESISAGVSAALSVSGVSAVLGRGVSTASATVLVSAVETDEVGIASHRTASMRNDVIARSSEWEELGGSPELGDTVTATFPDGQTRTLTVTSDPMTDRTFRHLDPAGEYVRVHTVVEDWTAATTTTSETTTTTSE